MQIGDVFSCGPFVGPVIAVYRLYGLKSESEKVDKQIHAEAVARFPNQPHKIEAEEDRLATEQHSPLIARIRRCLQCGILGNVVTIVSLVALSILGTLSVKLVVIPGLLYTVGLYEFNEWRKYLEKAVSKYPFSRG